jgi:small-conductance mechanosensitive channel
MAESALNLELRFYVEDEANGLVMRSRVLLAVYQALRQAGIEIPFVQREIRLRDAQALFPAAKA